MVIAALWLKFCWQNAKDFEEFSALLGLGIMVGVPICSVAYLLSMLIANAIRRHRVQKA